MGGTTMIPVPDSVTAGLVAASVDRLSVPALAPSVAGVNVMLTVQACPAGSVAGQLLVEANIAASDPVTEMLWMVSGPSPVFETFTVCAVDAVPTGCEPKSRLKGSTLATGAGG